MAAASATASICSIKAMSPSMRTSNRKVTFINGLGPFSGLKRHDSVVSLGMPVCTNQQFRQVLSSLRFPSKRGGGAMASKCNAAGEIFQIASIMNGLVLVGVAVGFVLLRVEAWLEEAEAE